MRRRRWSVHRGEHHAATGNSHTNPFSHTSPISNAGSIGHADTCTGNGRVSCDPRGKLRLDWEAYD